MKTQKSVVPKTPLGPVLRRYFCGHLISQRDLSPRTIGSYRDAFRLLLRFLERRYRIKPDTVCVEDLDAPRVLMFLDDLERRRGNTARTRNARLAAIRSFLRHAAAADPLLLPVAQRVLAIPAKRFERASVGYLTREQIQAIVDSPDAATFSGQRDCVLLMLLYNTVLGCQSLPVYGFEMYRWNRGCRFMCTVKVARIVRCRFGDKPSSCYVPGSDNSTVCPIRPYSQTPVARQ